MSVTAAQYTADGSIAAAIDGMEMIVPNVPTNRFRQMIADWESEGNIIGSYVAAPATVVPYIDGGALIRFSATNPITIYENLGMAGVARVAKGRYRITHQTPMPTDQYSVFPDVMDLAVKYVRYTARATNYVEVRVVDATGVAADATEVSVKIERVIAS